MNKILISMDEENKIEEQLEQLFWDYWEGRKNTDNERDFFKQSVRGFIKENFYSVN